MRDINKHDGDNDNDHNHYHNNDFAGEFALRRLVRMFTQLWRWAKEEVNCCYLFNLLTHVLRAVKCLQAGIEVNQDKCGKSVSEDIADCNVQCVPMVSFSSGLFFSKSRMNSFLRTSMSFFNLPWKAQRVVTD